MGSDLGGRALRRQDAAGPHHHRPVERTDGKADTIMVGLRGLVGQLFREDGAKKVRRGMMGVVRSGRHAGGRAYGYRPRPGVKGELEVIESEAAVVRRIFADYATGRPPREIAGSLNREGVEPPRGDKWNASTINGNAARGNGIIFNELYAGRIVWNKVRMVKDPETGRRVSRANDRSERTTMEADHLRIVDQETWDRAQSLKAAKAQLASTSKRRPPHLLSGLLRCASCGSGMSVHDRSESGRIRIRCSTVRESGTCDNTSRIRLERIERAVLDGMRAKLDDPELIKAYVKAYNEERQRLAGDAIRNRAKTEARLDEAQRELDRAIQNLIKGRLSDDEAGAVLPKLRAERDSKREELAACESVPKVIALHPAALAQYAATVDRLHETLGEHAHAADDRGDLLRDFRQLVHSVIVGRQSQNGEISIKVNGRLAALIGGEPFPQNVGVNVVAEEGLEPPTRGL